MSDNVCYKNKQKVQNLNSKMLGKEIKYITKIEKLILPHIDTPEEENRWIHFKHFTDENFHKRIYNWFVFFYTLFVENHQRNFQLDKKSLLKNTLNAIISFTDDEILNSQTSFQFFLSKNFYKNILESDQLIYFQNLEQAQFFLKMSLIFSAFPGLLHKSITKNAQILNPHPTVENQALFFRTIYCKFDNVCNFYLFKNLHKMNSKDVKIFLSLISGKSLRKINENLPQFSKKQTHLFLHCFPKDFIFQNNVFFYGWYFSKLLLINSDTAFFS